MSDGPRAAPRKRLEKLVEQAQCATCDWPLEPGRIVIRAAGETFCGDRCYDKAQFAPEHDLGGEGG